MTITADAPHARVQPRPLERLEAEICELASQLTAATCRLLLLIGEFDAAEGWRDWGMRSTAHWLSWKCGVGLTAAYEQVRVARALRELPTTRLMFSEGRLSYSKVRAITRIARDDTEAGLAEMAEYATGAQMDKVVAGYRRVRRNEDVRARRLARYLRYHFDEDGSLVGSFRLPPEDAAVFLQGLQIATGRLADDPAICGDDDADDPRDVRAHVERRSSADGLVHMAGRILDESSTGGPDGVPDRYQVVIHSSAEDSAATEDTGGDAGPHAESGIAVHPETVRRISCDCSTSTHVDGADGSPLHVGRRTRRITGRLRRAVNHRDGGRCRAPACTSKTAEIHHVRHWAHGGTTCLPNLISLCAAHHWLVHEGGWSIALPQPGEWVFLDPHGRRVTTRPQRTLPAAPLPHDPTVRPTAVTGRWAGERLSLSDAVDWMFQRGAMN